MMSTKNTLLLCAATAIVAAGLSCSERSIPVSYQQNTSARSCVTSMDIISTDWLYRNLDSEDLKIIDLRPEADYSAGHITNSVNIPFDVISVWATSDFGEGGLWVELPELSDLNAALGAYGISCDSKIVLVTGLPIANPYSLGSPGRVAMTLKYAGLRHVKLLDGAYEKWANEGKPVTTELPSVIPTDCNCEASTGIVVDMNYVENNLGDVILVDARDADVYSGAVLEPWSNGKAGHIPTAVSLPAASLWNTVDGTYKSKAQIETLAYEALGGDIRHKGIVVYCGVGGYAGTVWFALTKILGYRNVKVYDGSAQEWVMFHDMEM